jgi:hypothetical protein
VRAVEVRGVSDRDKVAGGLETAGRVGGVRMILGLGRIIRRLVEGCLTVGFTVFETTGRTVRDFATIFFEETA